MTCVCIIPARGGSRRIPKKNIRPFHGRPIIEYSIEAAQKAGIFDLIAVSTDDHEIAEVAVKAGAAFITRPPIFASNAVGTQTVMRNALSTAKIDADHACCLYATAPLLQPATLQRAFYTLLNTGADYIVPVAMWLRDPGQFYFGTSDAFREGRPLIGEWTGMIKIPPETECDINTEDDWRRAEEMYLQLKETTT